jgi:hypothetical protein
MYRVDREEADVKTTVPTVGLLLCALLACKSGEKKSPPAPASAAPEPVAAASPSSPNAAAAASPSAPSTAVAPPTPAAAPASASGSGYPTEGLKTIADNCKVASAILASVPKRVVEGWKDGHEWNWATQALLAHREFTLRDDTTEQSMEVKLLQYDQPNGVVALVAHCHDGVTCNKLAAMYKFTVPGAKPQLFCGAKIPSLQGVGATIVKLTPFGGADQKIPDAKNVIGRCARLHICSRKLDRSTPEDLGLSCQRAPMKFKIACAAKKSCQEVVSCMKS